MPVGRDTETFNRQSTDDTIKTNIESYYQKPENPHRTDDDIDALPWILNWQAQVLLSKTI